MYRDGPSKQQKILGYPIIVFVLLFLYSLFSNALVFDDVSRKLMLISAGIWCVWVILFTIFYFSPDSMLRKRNRNDGHDTLSDFVIIPAAIAFLTYGGVVVGLPKLLHDFTGQSSQLMVTVKKLDSRYKKRTSYRHSRDCSGKVYLEEFLYVGSDYICGIQIEDWKDLKPGDSFRLTGIQSEFGFSYRSYEL